MLFLRRATISGAARRPIDPGAEDPAGYSVVAADSEAEPGVDRDAWGVPRGTETRPEETSPAVWAYTIDEPSLSWTKRSFNDKRWARGTAGFGSAGAAGLTVATPWVDSLDLWLRRSFVWEPGADEPRLYAIHDDSLEVFINGKLAAQAPLWSGGRYIEYSLSKAARKVLRRGENVIAAHAHDTGGGRSLDVRFTEPLGASLYSAHWWATRPYSDVAFIRRWQIAGPVTDSEHQALLALQCPEQLDEDGWSELRVLGDRLDLGAALAAKSNSLCWAATWLIVDEPVQGYLWLGSAGGLRAWLDDAPLMLNHEHRSARADELRVPIQLNAGSHRLVFAVEQQGAPAVLWARLAGETGAALEGLTYALEAGSERSPVESARALAAHPAQLSLLDLAAVLPETPAAALELRSAEHLQTMAVWSTGAESPRWIDRPQAKDPAPNAPSGARGVLLLQPRAEQRPARLALRVTLPPDAAGFSVNVAAPSSVGAGARVRLGVVVAGAVSWIADEVVLHGKRAGKGRWVDVKGVFEQPPENPALLLLLVESHADSEPAALFLDSIALR